MKIRIILPLFLFVINSYSQFSTKTEYDYLKLINFQRDKKLILSSTHNADLVANKLILENPSELNTLFYNELSQSYYIAKQYETAFYYQLLQRIFFYNDSIANKTKSQFYDSGYKMGLEKREVDFFWKKTFRESSPKLKNDKIMYSLQLATKLYVSELTDRIYQRGLLLRKQNYTMPQWYKDWEYITRIEIKEKDKKNYLDYTSTTPIFKRLKSKQLTKLYSKSINYYTKKHAFSRAEELKTPYKEGLSFFGKSDVFIKKLVTLYHKVI